MTNRDKIKWLQFWLSYFAIAFVIGFVAFMISKI